MKKDINFFTKRINIFTGHFGSGKSEISVNAAFNAKKFQKTALIDLDIINPYFRSADAKNVMEEHGIDVLLPLFANTNVDVPALPGEINRLFEDISLKVIFDVGGDDLGAKAISRYKEDFLKEDFDMFFVINARRQLSQTAREIVQFVGEIEESARMKVTKLVNNTNVLNYTDVGVLKEGLEIVKEAAEILKKPVAFTAVMEDIAAKENLNDFDDLFRLKKYIRLPFDYE